MLTNDDEPMPTAVRQRRLLLIDMLTASLRSPEHYSSSIYGPRLPGAYGWITSPVIVGYHGNNIISHSRVPSSDNNAPTVIYARNRLRPVIQVIRVQPGNVPFSDSDNDEPKRAVV
ncbi:uncoordinated protein 2 [Loa loa]|uniref:Uncoordinated protein 2 n=1 Tax=Loa loa TaxID=7209 RepID=A0A1I7V7W7_LOALO|nr:uncoordinated protein 2 [Loa loa]EFO16962.1 uncoordinated protein 2 [Loa loa]